MLRYTAEGVLLLTSIVAPTTIAMCAMIAFFALVLIGNRDIIYEMIFK